MTHSKLGRTLLGAALTVLLSTVALAPASADPAPVVTTLSIQGFAKPVKNTPVGTAADKVVWNKVKAGSTVPLKFKVYQTVDGVKTAVKDASVVTAFAALQVACGTETLASPKTIDLMKVTKKGFALKYSKGAFHQNWKTAKLPKAAKVKGKSVPVTECYQVTLTVANTVAAPVSVMAYFKLR